MKHAKGSNKGVVYISGAITGVDDYKERFDEAEKRIRWAGYVPLNPTVLPSDLPYSAYIPINLAMVAAADIVYVLPGSEQSKGVAAEVAFAKASGIKVAKNIIDF